MIYLIPIILLFYGIVKYDYLNHVRGKLFFWIFICISLAVIAGLRYKLGEDTLYYLHAYNKIKPLNTISLDDFQNSRYAPGFIVLFSFFKMLTPEMLAFQLFQALVVNTIFFYFIYKNCRHIFFAGLLYYVFMYILMSFLQLREALAVSVFLLAWPAFKQGKWLWWYLAAFVAFSFHLSAMIMFLLPLICLPKIRLAFTYGKQTWIIILVVLVTGYVLNVIFFKYIELLSFTEAMRERAEAYDKDKLGGAILNFKGIMSQLVEYIIYPMIALYFVNRNRIEEKLEKTFNKVQALVLINTFIVVFSFFISIALRLTNYFFPFVIIFLGDWIFSVIKYKGKLIRLGLITWIIFFLPMLVAHGYGLSYGKINKSGTLRAYMLYYPYSSYFDKSNDQDREKAIRYVFKPKKRSL